MSTKTRFEEEAKGNSEMAYYTAQSRGISSDFSAISQDNCWIFPNFQNCALCENDLMTKMGHSDWLITVWIINEFERELVRTIEANVRRNFVMKISLLPIVPEHETQK